MYLVLFVKSFVCRLFLKGLYHMQLKFHFLKRVILSIIKDEIIGDGENVRITIVEMTKMVFILNNKLHIFRYYLVSLYLVKRAVILCIWGSTLPPTKFASRFHRYAYILHNVCFHQAGKYLSASNVIICPHHMHIVVDY